MVRLSISSCRARSFIVNLTNHLERVEHFRRSSYLNKKERESCTKWSFWLETPVLEWLVMVLVLLDRLVVALGYKKVVPLRFKVLLTF